MSLGTEIFPYDSDLVLTYFCRELSSVGWGGGQGQRRVRFPLLLEKSLNFHEEGINTRYFRWAKLERVYEDKKNVYV